MEATPMRYAVVIEKAGGNFGAYVPYLPGCIATGATEAEVATNIQAAIEMHLQGMIEDGLLDLSGTATTGANELPR